MSVLTIILAVIGCAVICVSLAGGFSYFVDVLVERARKRREDRACLERELAYLSERLALLEERSDTRADDRTDAV